MLVGLSARLSPIGELFAASVTVPVKPLMLDMETVELEVALARNVRLTGLDVIEKSDLKNSAMGAAFRSLAVRAVRFQFTSNVFVREYPL